MMKTGASRKVLRCFSFIAGSTDFMAGSCARHRAGDLLESKCLCGLKSFLYASFTWTFSGLVSCAFHIRPECVEFTLIHDVIVML
jgi:hypothetical protein